MLQKIMKKIQYEKVKPLIYSEELRDAYLSASITGGTLKGKTVFVTGATGGIGVAMTLRFLREGSHVILAGRNLGKLNDTVHYIKSKISNASLEVQILDQLDIHCIENCVNELKDRDSFIDILVNNAGIVTEVDKKRKFRTVSEEQFNNVWNTNYDGTVYFTNLVADEMQSRGIQGCIIQIASICAIFRNFQYTPYGLSKTAIVQYSKLLRERYKNLNVHVIEPGSVATGMGNLKIGDNIGKNINVVKRPVLPEEVAALAAFLSGPCGKYIKNNAIVASACEVL